MPVALLIAMVLAFGVRVPTESNAFAKGELTRSLAWSSFGVLVVAMTGALFGLWISARVTRLGIADRIARRRFRIGG